MLQFLFYLEVFIIEVVVIMSERQTASKEDETWNIENRES